MMLDLNVLKTSGDHTMILMGAVGSLEAILTVPETVNAHYVAILGHPHSLQGGTMHNKVITTLARLFKDLGIVSLRFNFRGVGASDGIYDAGVGESEDMLCLTEQCLKILPKAAVCFAGFSFGSYVAYRAAAQHAHRLLITVAPPVHHYDYTQWQLDSKKWVVIQGAQDDISPLSLVQDFSEIHGLDLIHFAAAGHFFHGQLIALRNELMAYFSQKNIFLEL